MSIISWYFASYGSFVYRYILSIFLDPEPPIINILYGWSRMRGQFGLCYFMFSPIVLLKLIIFVLFYHISVFDFFIFMYSVCNFQSLKSPWKRIAFSKNSFIISPVWLDAILDGLQTRPIRQILLLLWKNSFADQNCKLYYVFICSICICLYRLYLIVFFYHS